MAIMIVIAGALLALLPAAPAPAVEVELLRNGGFEAAGTSSGWRADSWAGEAAAPMADTGYVPYQKPPERFRRELRLIGHAGAPAVMIYLYSTLRQSPELREVIAEELAN